MFFLNQYIPEYAGGGYTAKRIGDFIYRLGSLSAGDYSRWDGLVTKLTLSGSVVWQKKYIFEDEKLSANFHEIVECDNGDLFLTGSFYTRDDQEVFACRLTSQGRVLWSVKIPKSKWRGYHGHVNLLRIAEEKYLFLLEMEGRPVFFTFDEGGNHASYQPLVGDYRSLVQKNESVMAFSGSYYAELDISMQVLDSQEVNRMDENNTLLSLIIYQNDYLYLFGGTQGMAFGGKFHADESPTTSLTIDIWKEFEISHGNSRHFYGGGNGNYYKMDHGFNPVWKKQYDSIEADILSQATEDEIIMHGYEGDVSIGRLGLDFESCRSAEVPFKFEKTQGKLYLEKFKEYLEPFKSSVDPVRCIEQEVDVVFKKLCEFEPDDTIKITDFAVLQSPHLYLQATGSRGEESTYGNHLRWTLKNALSSHLPKGNYAGTGANFNRSDDYMKIYRARYEEIRLTLSFLNPPASVSEGASNFWTYNIDGKQFRVYFLDREKYQNARMLYDPYQVPLNFVVQYGDGTMEVECLNELCFAVTPHIVFTKRSTARVELLSVEENRPSAPRAASLRKTYSSGSLSNVKLLSENIRSIRYACVNGYVDVLHFELYSAAIANGIKSGMWKFTGKHALTKDTATAMERLEPLPGALSGWLRYNDGAYVNPENYRQKWDGQAVDTESRIRSVVAKYIELSDAQGNPEGIETYSMDGGDGEGDEEDFEISNLHLLQVSALDYHVARMLGLGTLDLEHEIYTGKYIYLAEYYTAGDLRDGLGAREVQHIYCSLPTGQADQRLPLPVDLKEPKPGFSYGPGIEAEAVTTDAQGYSHDGRSRFLSLYHVEIPEEAFGMPFFYSSYEFVSSECTVPVYGGIEYRRSGAPEWQKPELSFDREFHNIDGGTIPALRNESLPIIIPEAGYPMFVHREKRSGVHQYGSYGINWFSRSARSQAVHTVETLIRPANSLLPPSNLNAVLVREENPLLLTSASEQDMLARIVEEDRTLVRLTFEYNHSQELVDYHVSTDGEIVSGYAPLEIGEELFADRIEVFFRNEPPASVSGKITSVAYSQSEPLFATVSSGEFVIESSGAGPSGEPNDVLFPSVATGREANFIGGILLADGKEYVIHAVDNSQQYPVFTIFVGDASGALIDSPSASVPDEVQLPQSGSLFILVENMLNELSWETPDEHLFPISAAFPQIHQEYAMIENMDGSREEHLQRFRGIYEKATIEKIFEDTQSEDGTLLSEHRGLYRIIFDNVMPQHPQYSGQPVNSVEWHNGIARLRTIANPEGYRKEFRVVRTENIGGPGNLAIFISDLSFPATPAEAETYTGYIMEQGQDVIVDYVNYYPGYKAYLYKNDAYGLNEQNLLPDPEIDEQARYSIFGVRSHDDGENFNSRISVPALMFAQANRAPAVPYLPTGGDYATRPDFFGKSSYTFKTSYRQKPHAVQFNRASDIQFLSSIYDSSRRIDQLGNPVPSTVEHIMDSIFQKGEEAFYVDRWKNLLGFDYRYGGPPQDSGFPDEDGKFKYFEGVRLPMPDSPAFIASINAFIREHNRFYNNQPAAVPAIQLPIADLYAEVIPEVMEGGRIRNGKLQIADFLKDIMLNCFVPLTEIPILYRYIKGPGYSPIPKKQVVRDRNGNLLAPSLLPGSEFDMAPMMKITGGAMHETQFTDFGIDGASNARYFYAAREISLQMKTSDYSPISGPVSLVNSAPPAAPEIIKVVPVMENRVLGTASAIRLQVNSYAKAQNIRKINIYRAWNASDALSVRTMDLIRSVDLEAASISEDREWVFEDDFSDLPQVPYGDPLYYRLSVSRIIKYNDREGETVVDLAPSDASKSVLTNIVENYIPESPVLKYASEPITAGGKLERVTLFWDETAYKGTYHIYKMGTQGNWVKISTAVSDRLARGRYAFYNSGNLPGSLPPAAESTAVNGKVYLPLELTDWNGSALETGSLDGMRTYHHFKVISENTSGMLSSVENILTVYSPDTWNDLGGVGEMSIEETFVVR